MKAKAEAKNNEIGIAVPVPTPTFQCFWVLSFPKCILPAAAG